MQKQKTIAKWLAVILLLTVAVGCYIALNAILPNGKNSSIAGANGDNDNQGNVITPTPTPTPTPQPVYTTLPRKGESINGMTVQHVGGDGEDILLDSLYQNGKRLLIFSTTSTQYDVKESGLYVAVFEKSSLIELVKIADDSEKYVNISQTSNGLLFITQTLSNTIFRLLSSDLKILAINTSKLYPQIALVNHGGTTKLVAHDGNFLKVIEVSSSLKLTESNFVYQSPALNVHEVIAYGEDILIFARCENDTYLLHFNQKSGFSLKNSIVNTDIVQIMPFFYNGVQMFFTLSFDDDGAQITCFSTEFEVLEKTTISAITRGVLLSNDSGITLVSNEEIIDFCAHLDILSRTKIEDTFANGQYENIRGFNQAFLVRYEDKTTLLKLNDKSIESVFECNAKSDKFIVEKCAPQDSAYNTAIIFTANSLNSFAYMNFGQNDVYMLYAQTLIC